MGRDTEAGTEAGTEGVTAAGMVTGIHGVEGATVARLHRATEETIATPHRLMTGAP